MLLKLHECSMGSGRRPRRIAPILCSMPLIRGPGPETDLCHGRPVALGPRDRPATRPRIREHSIRGFAFNQHSPHLFIVMHSGYRPPCAPEASRGVPLKRLLTRGQRLEHVVGGFPERVRLRRACCNPTASLQLVRSVVRYPSEGNPARDCRTSLDAFTIIGREQVGWDCCSPARTFGQTERVRPARRTPRLFTTDTIAL